MELGIVHVPARTATCSSRTPLVLRPGLWRKAKIPHRNGNLRHDEIVPLEQYSE